MNEDFTRAGKAGQFFFFIGAIIIIISASVFNAFSFPIRLAGGIFLLADFLALIFLHNRTKELTYQILQSISFIILALMLGCIFSSSTIFFCTIALQSAVMLMYMDSGFMKIQSMIITAVLIAAGIPSFIGLPSSVP
ncbi:MAG: hypothetical protein ACI4RG_11115, partial [Huintestinicola sp.]